MATTFEEALLQRTQSLPSLSLSEDGDAPVSKAGADFATIPQTRKGRRLSWSEVVPIKTFLCPISGRLLEDPVITADGHTYEKQEIETWFRGGARSSPLTGTPLPHTQTIRNHALRNAIGEYMARLKSQKPYLEAKSMRVKVEANSSREDELQTECEALRIDVATASVELERVKKDLAFLERSFQERALVAKLDDGGGTLSGGGGGGGGGGTAVGGAVSGGIGGVSTGTTSFIDSLPPWMRKIAVIGAGLESQLVGGGVDEDFDERDSGDWSPKTFPSLRSSTSSPSSPLSPKSPKSPKLKSPSHRLSNGGATKNFSGIVSDTSLANLGLLVEEELSFLSEEAIRRALRRRRMVEAAAEDIGDGDDADGRGINKPLDGSDNTSASKRGMAAASVREAMLARQASYDSAEARERKADMRASELEAFSSMYEALNGPEWCNSSGWGSDPEYGRWYGVAVFGAPPNGIFESQECYDRAFSAVELILPHNKLDGGPLPHQLAFLTNLRILNLENNAIVGWLPSALGALVNLMELNLKDNALSGPLAPVEDLSKLTTLSLSWNNLSGPLPELRRGRLLRTLDLAGNRCHGRIPESYGNLGELRTLWLHFNRLTGPIPPSIHQARKLRHLSLFENRLNGRCPPELGTLLGLRKLLLASNKLTGRLPWELCNLTNLTELSLQNNLFVKDTDIAKNRRAKQLPLCRILI